MDWFFRVKSEVRGWRRHVASLNHECECISPLFATDSRPSEIGTHPMEMFRLRSDVGDSGYW